MIYTVGYHCYRCWAITGISCFRRQAKTGFLAVHPRPRLHCRDGTERNRWCRCRRWGREDDGTRRPGPAHERLQRGIWRRGRHLECRKLLLQLEQLLLHLLHKDELQTVGRRCNRRNWCYRCYARVAATSGPGGEAGASSSTRHSARCSASGNAGTSSRLNMRPEHAAQVDRRWFLQKLSRQLSQKVLSCKRYILLRT